MRDRGCTDVHVMNVDEIIFMLFIIYCAWRFV